MTEALQTVVAPGGLCRYTALHCTALHCTALHCTYVGGRSARKKGKVAAAVVQI
jgi:hypothetical protein